MLAYRKNMDVMLNQYKTKSEDDGSFGLAAKTLLVISTSIAFVGAIDALRRHDRVLPGSLVGRHPFTLWAILLISTTIVVLTVDRWAKILPGMLAYGSIGGVIMVASGRSNRVPISRWQALSITLLMISSAAVSKTFVDRRLKLFDRTILISFVFCIAFSVSTNLVTVLIALGTGLVLLLFGWSVNILRRRRHDSPRTIAQTQRRSSEVEQHKLVE